MLLVIEGIVMSFFLLIYCVIGIANGPVGLVVLYEKDVQERAVELGYTTKAKIKKSFIISCLALYVPVFVITPLMVYFINGADSFFSGFWQMTVILLIMGLFDRFFIDWYWVGHTKTWIISGTEDLRPYIPGKVLLRKWLATIIGFPAIAAIIAGIISIF